MPKHLNGYGCQLSHGGRNPSEKKTKITAIAFLGLYIVTLWGILCVKSVSYNPNRRLKRPLFNYQSVAFPLAKNSHSATQLLNEKAPLVFYITANATDGVRRHCVKRNGRFSFIKSAFPLTRHTVCLNILHMDDRHAMLRQLNVERDKHFKSGDEDDEEEEVVERDGKEIGLYRYFNITKKNLETHLNATLNEFYEGEREKDSINVSIIDGNSFNGDYTGWNLPLPKEMTAYEFEGLNPKALKPIAEYQLDIKPQFGDDMLDSIYGFINEPREQRPANSTADFIEHYDNLGDLDYEQRGDRTIFFKPYLQDVEFTLDDEAKENRKVMHRVLSHPTMYPSYLDPENIAHRTGRRREVQKRADSGRLQRLRWKMDVDYEDDIPRGNWTRGDNITKEFLDSIEWEHPMPTYHDRNFFKRSYFESGFGDVDRTVDNYFDAQFIGSTDTYPFAESAGMQFAWPLYWVPMLCKSHPKRRGQPLRSPIFNLGGVEPLQLWFYPEGCAQSQDGYCGVKLVSPPGCEYNRVVIGPMYRESPACMMACRNFCRLIDKSIRTAVDGAVDNADYVILGPAGNVYLGVGIVDEPVRKPKEEFRYKYDWDEGDYDMLQWLKRQTVDPDDAHYEDEFPKDFTHSIYYESHKYKYVPDRHLSRYWRDKFTRNVPWHQPNF